MFKKSILGFIFSLVLTLGAFFWVVNKLPEPGLVVFIFAVVQMAVQMIFFLHTGEGDVKRWSSLFFISTMAVVIIVVAGCLWIMKHLNYNMMPQGHEAAEQIMHKEAIYK